MAPPAPATRTHAGVPAPRRRPEPVTRERRYPMQARLPTPARVRRGARRRGGGRGARGLHGRGEDSPAASALRGFYRRRARRVGIREAETGAVTAIQRFGSGVNLNVHFHTLALDGVFARDGDDWRFVAAPPAVRVDAALKFLIDPRWQAGWRA